MANIIAGPSGGTGGTPFDDDPPAEGAMLSEVRIWAGSAIEGLQTVLLVDGVLIENARHGGATSGIAALKLDPGEVVTEIYGRYGSYVEQLSLRTSRGRTRRFGGIGGPCEFAYFAPPGYHIIGFWGRAGHLVDALGVHFAPVG